MRVPAAVSWRSVCFSLTLIASSLQGYGKLPLAFEPNVGQTDRRVTFLARGSGFELFLTQTEAVYRLQTSVIRMRLAGAIRVPAHGVDRLESESHYLDRTPSITHVPHYGRVEMHQIYPGIDLTYHGNDSHLEYDFVVSPGADPRAIAFNTYRSRL